MPKIMLTLPSKLNISQHPGHPARPAHTHPMQLIRNPFAWLARIRHRRGYGIHSPWAYNFVRNVILERTPYYEYARLERLHPWYERHLLRYHIHCCRLLFRLANYAQPRHFDIFSTYGEYLELEFEYIQQTNPKMDVPDGHDAYVADLCFVKANAFRDYVLQPCKMLIIEGIHRDKYNRAHWEAVKADPRTGCTFDTYTYGIAFFDLTRHKQHYTICF